MKALIKAATSSLGKVIARQLASEGYRLTLHYNSNKDLAQKLATELNAEVVQADLSKDADVNKFLESVLKSGPFDVLVNNAKVSGAHDVKNVGDWQRTFLVNTTVPALLLAHADKLVNDDGVVVNISSAYGHLNFGELGLEAYSASKAALNSLTTTFAKKLGPRVRVNAIAPGYVHSKWNEGLPTKKIKEYQGHALTNKLVEPEQVAELVAHIIKNTALDGSIIYLDGGLTLKTI